MGKLGETEIGIVLSEQNAIFGPGGKHPVRLIHALIDKVVDEYANVSLVSAQHQRLMLGHILMGVGTGHNSLRCSLLITGGAIHLTGQEKIVHGLGTQRIMQGLRVKIIVLHRIGRLKENGILKALNGMYGVLLHFQRKRRRKALQVILGGVFPLRFQEKLVGVFIGKSTQLIFYAGAIAGSFAMNASGKEGRAVKAGAENVVHLLIGMQKETGHLLPGGLHRRRDVHKRETLRRGVPFLDPQLGQVYGTDVKPWRCAGFHAGRGNAQRGQLFSQAIRSFLSYAPPFKGMLTNEHAAVQEGAGG